MNLFLRTILRLSCAVPPPLVQFLAGREPSVLLYHGVPRHSRLRGKYAFDADAFENQMIYLKSKFSFITKDHFFIDYQRCKHKYLLVTFDDGFRNNATVAADILIRHQVPAIFFVCNRHVGTGRLLWFNYLAALELRFPHSSLEFRGASYDMSPERRAASVNDLTCRLLDLSPHPEAMYSAIANELPPWESFVSQAEAEDWFLGMTENQMRELDANPLFSVEAHTVDHPFLTRCNSDELVRQIGENKTYIEDVCSKKVVAVAYPSGDYNNGVLEACQRLGLNAGYAVAPSVNKWSYLEIPHAGIYQSAREVALFKALWARRRVGYG